jgi:hypothetical protein
VYYLTNGVTIRQMAIEQILTLLILERNRLNNAIEALQGPTKRRGKPPKTIATPNAAESQPTVRKRRNLTAAQRKAHSERMKKFWAERRKSQKAKG